MSRRTPPPPLPPLPPGEHSFVTDLVFDSTVDDWHTTTNDGVFVFCMFHRASTRAFYFYRYSNRLTFKSGNGRQIGVFDLDSWFCGKLMSMFPSALRIMMHTE